MSAPNEGDSTELKLKYQEIAALKKAIAEKQQLKDIQQKLQLRRNVVLQKKRHQKKYRNMTLVMNNSSPQASHESSSNGNSLQNSQSASGYVSVVSKGAMSFINQSIYNDNVKRKQEQAEAIKQKQKEQKIIQRIQNRISKFKVQFAFCDRVKINGEKFAVVKHGRVLAPLSYPQSSNPSEVVWNHEDYIRKGSEAFKMKTNRKSKHKTRDPCRYFTMTGFCQKGSTCKYIHDKNKIKICPLFLSGKCFNRNCLLSHACNDNNTAMCRYFLENKCHNSNCKYRHMKPPHYDDPNYEIWTCRPFAIGGWCLRGKRCPFLHLPNCPDFEENGYCSRKQECPFNHQVTLRTQEQISTRSNKYIREEVEVETQKDDKPEKIIISSYTVDPEVLFINDTTNNYQYYIDNTAQELGSKEDAPLSEFLIEISDTESEFSLDEDQLEGNDDYVSI